MDKKKGKRKKPQQTAEKPQQTAEIVVKEVKLSDLKVDDKNFNKGTQFGQRLIEKSLRENGAGRSILLDKNNRIIAGNKTTENAAAIDMDDVIVVETDGTKLVAVKRTDIDLDSEQGRKMALADNATSAANLEWDEEQLKAMSEEMDGFNPEEWGIEFQIEQQEDGENEGESGNGKYNGERIDKVEKWLDDAMRKNALEFLEMIDYDIKKGWLPRGVTQGFCEAQFLKAKFYGMKYKSVYNLYFQPKRFLCPSGKKNDSIKKAFKGVASGEKSGLKGLRTATSDGNLATFYSSNYPVGHSAAAADFPPEIARNLYNEFAFGRGISVLDPCHGWGGRLVGALLTECVKSYTGFDPSNDANEGVVKIKDAYGKYCETDIYITKGCYEEQLLKAESFDLALTSPPYFDVEKYEGDNTSHLKFPQYDLWVEGFYKPLIEKTFYALKKGGYFLLQVGSQSYPLENDGMQIAQSVGFEICEKRLLGGSTASGLKTKNIENGEIILVLKK